MNHVVMMTTMSSAVRMSRKHHEDMRKKHNENQEVSIENNIENNNSSDKVANAVMGLVVLLIILFVVSMIDFSTINFFTEEKTTYSYEIPIEKPSNVKIKEVEMLIEVPILEQRIIEKEVPVEVEKIVEVPMEIEKEIPVEIIEIPVEVEKIVEVPIINMPVKE